MFSLAQMPWATTLFTAYASITGSIMLARTLANQLIPAELQTLLVSKLRFHFRPMSSEFTVVIQEYDGLVRNQIYDAAELLLQSRITPTVERLKVHKVAKEKDIVLGMDKGQEVIDVFRGIQLKWKYISETVRPDPVDPFAEDRSFELKFHKKHKDQVLASYLPYLLNRANAIKEEKKVVKLHATCALHSNGNGNGPWGSINLDHPATFDTLAMDHKLKREIIDDLDRFVRRREFYKKVGKAWKRGYLLYGPPGTGKSSLIAAMANYLKFDVYDLELRNVMSNGELKKLLVATANRSILVVEDIDCSMDLTNREPTGLGYGQKNKITLSGLLNFIDGLWSSCGDERIIIFTTNHKDRLDPALLRPGRMDKHIHLSYCTTQGFNILASNYLGIHNGGQKSELCLAIEESIENSKVTPAEVAEELMKSEESDIALAGLLEFLKRKRIEQDEPKTDEEEFQEPKRLKV